MMKWILSPIATLKRKIVLFVAKRAVKRLRKATQDEVLWVAGKLHSISKGLESFANGDLDWKQVMKFVEGAYDYGKELFVHIKKR